MQRKWYEDRESNSSVVATSQTEEKEEMCPRGTDIGVMKPQVKKCQQQP